MESWYEYFAPEGKVASFDTDELDLGLWDRKFTSGSIIKLYSYELPRGSTSDITIDLWRDMNQYLYHPALPVLMWDKRFTARVEQGRNPTKPMPGNKTRITIDNRDQVDQIISFKIEEKNIPIEVIVFNADTEHKEFIKNKSIIFTQNGQVHGSYGQSYISQGLGFGLLKDSMLINVDCSNIRTNLRQNLFMANRTHLKEGKHTEELKARLI